MSNEAQPAPPLSRIVRDLPVSGIRRFFDVADRMQDVISLSVGEPDFATPWAIREAAIYSLERGRTTYTSNYGLLELRREISRHLEQWYNVRYRPDDEVLVTVGVSEGMDLAMRVLLDPGDEVLVPEPCYVSYKPCVALAGGVPVGVPTRAEDRFRVSVAQLEAAATPRTKAILLGFPSNPTGATMPREALQEVVDYARRRNLYLVSDEIYDRLTYDAPHTCVASLPGAWDRTITLNGFSKAYAMTGWRIGYAAAPASVLSAMCKVHAYTMLCAPIMGQKAALEALKSGESAVQDMVTQYNQRRRFIVDGLNKIGLTCHMPAGAFYAFPDITRTGLTSEQFAERLLFEEHVAVVPGTAFGAGGEGHIRCSYATGLEKIEIALQRMAAFVRKVAPPSQEHSPRTRPMQYGDIPGVPKPLSRLIQGTATDFDPAHPDACLALLDMALAHGITTFDTAHCYGADRSKIFGRWMRERGVRDRIVVLAKGAHPYGHPRVTPADIEADLADTLDWMQTDAVELFVLHRDDPAVPVGAIVEVLNKLQAEGRISAFGGSNWSVTRVREANEYAASHGLTPFRVSSPNYSLAEQVQPPWDGCLTISGPQNDAARAWYAGSGLALLPWSSLAGGFWSGRFHRDNLDTFAPDNDFAQLAIKCYCHEPNFRRLDRARDLARQKAVTVPQVALAFVLNQPLNIFPLISCADEAMFAANTAALEIRLTPQECAWLDLRADDPAE